MDLKILGTVPYKEGVTKHFDVRTNMNQNADASNYNFAALKNSLELSLYNVVYHFRGAWSYATATGDEPYTYRVEFDGGRKITHIDWVEYDGYRWACMLTGTTDVPSMDTSAWMLVDERIGRTVRLEITTDGQTILDWGESLTVRASVCLELTPVALIPYFQAEKWQWSITRETGDEIEDEAWNRGEKAKKFAEEIGSGNFVIISYKDGENDLHGSTPKNGAKFVLRAVGVTGGVEAQAEITL